MGNMSIPSGTHPTSMTGYSPIPEGRYHCMIVDVLHTTSRNGKPYDRLKLQILAGEQPNQEGKTFTNSLFYKEDHGGYVEGEIHIRWAWATGVLKEGQSIDFYPDMLRGKQIIVEVVRQKDSQFSEVADRGFSVWTLDSPEVASVPKAKLDEPIDGDDYL